LSVGVYFVSEPEITQTPTVIAGQVVTERNVSVFSGWLDNVYCDARLPFEDMEILDILDEVCSL
jgi:hypothetical protein